MKTLSRIAVVSLALLGASAARGDAGVIFVCPESVNVAPDNSSPAGWTRIGTAQFFHSSEAEDRFMACTYSPGGVKPPMDLSALKKEVPPGMKCTVNKSKPRQFDCLKKK